MRLLTLAALVMIVSSLVALAFTPAPRPRKARSCTCVPGNECGCLSGGTCSCGAFRNN